MRLLKENQLIMSSR